MNNSTINNGNLCEFNYFLKKFNYLTKIHLVTLDYKLSLGGFEIDGRQGRSKVYITPLPINVYMTILLNCMSM